MIKNLPFQLFLVITAANFALCAHAQPITITPVQNSPANEWQTFQDSRYIFQFEYPAKWITEDRQGAGGPSYLKMNKRTKSSQSQE